MVRTATVVVTGLIGVHSTMQTMHECTPIKPVYNYNIHCKYDSITFKRFTT